jgi:hypothetical protein
MSKVVKHFELLKDFEDPYGSVAMGTIKTEEEWMDRFGILDPGDCQIKTDWFQEVGRYPMCNPQPAQIDCRMSGCYFNRKGDCLNEAPAITIREDKSVCWSEIGNGCSHIPKAYPMPKGVMCAKCGKDLNHIR